VNSVVSFLGIDFNTERGGEPKALQIVTKGNRVEKLPGPKLLKVRVSKLPPTIQEKDNAHHGRREAIHH
jgi:hypothetical protein